LLGTQSYRHTHTRKHNRTYTKRHKHTRVCEWDGVTPIYTNANKFVERFCLVLISVHLSTNALFICLFWIQFWFRLHALLVSLLLRFSDRQHLWLILLEIQIQIKPSNGHTHKQTHTLPHAETKFNAESVPSFAFCCRCFGWWLVAALFLYENPGTYVEGVALKPN